jgi:hypothetical protein
MTGKSGPFTGSDCLPMGPDRHGSLKNRHGYFTNPLIWPRIGRKEPTGCPKKALFSAVIAADNPRVGMQYARTRKNHSIFWKFGIRECQRILTYRETGILDLIRIPGCSGGRSEPGKTKPESGSDCLPMGQDRHGFLKNRHGYFTNPSFWARIDGMESVMRSKKALFSTVTADDRRVDRAVGRGIRKNPFFPGVSV